MTNWQQFARYAVVAVTSLLVLTCRADGAEFTGYGVLTSDYVHRGVTYSDGHFAAQLGIDVDFDSGFYLGAWASTIDIQNGPTRQRDRQFNYYLGYAFDLGNHWSLGANVVALTFPGQTGNVDYDYEEFTISANYRDVVWLEVSWSPDLYHSGYESRNVALLFEWPLGWDVMLGAGGGYYDASDLTGEGYGYWQLGVTRPFGIVDIDLRYHDTNRWVPIVSSADRAEARVSLSARIHF